MTWVARIALTAIVLALIRSLWSGLGPPWRWPSLLLQTVRVRLHRVRARVRLVGGLLRQRLTHPPADSDPFTALQLQHRLGLIATELRVLEAADADRTYYARAHRIQTRRSAYDQLLAEACALAGVPRQQPGPPGRPHRVADNWPVRNADERFSAEMELAARGWHW